MERTPKEILDRINRVDDVLISSMDESYELMRKASEIHDEQNKMMVFQLGMGLLANFPEARTLRLAVSDGTLISQGLMDSEGTVILDGEDLEKFVIVEGSISVDNILSLLSMQGSFSWLYHVTAEPEIYDAPFSPIYLEYMEESFVIDLLKTESIIDIS